MVNCFRFCRSVPPSGELDAWVRQLIHSSSSVGANHRASQRAKSTADFINKLKIVEEEVDETAYWLELFMEVIENDLETIQKLYKEAEELLAIIVASIKRARMNKK